MAASATRGLGRMGRLLAGAGACACAAAAPFVPAPAAAASPEPPLSAKEFRPLTVSAVKQLSHNTKELRFDFPDKAAPAGLPVASCLVVRAPIGSVKDDGSRANVIRPYTPTSAKDSVGHLDLVVKVYEQGKMSKHIGGLKVGDTLDFKGPMVKFQYTPNEHAEVGMVAGGTGITPMLQVADEILGNPDDKTKVSLVFANVTEKDILLRGKIDAMAAAHPSRFSVYYVLDSPGFFWRGGKGYITADMLKEKMPAPGSAGSKVFVCGPPGMMKVVCGGKVKMEQGPLEGHLKELGYTEEQVFKF
mmetsp:Transcript_22921/g.78018  ORF Transcript_22921/g.78018 Transcript_22921/m.78018 type:complete len:303 (-) Transcript_22921:620-1528(-)